jgi:hypothetical protein
VATDVDTASEETSDEEADIEHAIGYVAEVHIPSATGA